MKKMNLAVCFSGLASGHGKGKQHTIDSIKHSDSYKKYLFQDHNIDIFMHSWSEDMEEALLNIYEPKSWLFEEQKIFHEDYKISDGNFLFERKVNLKPGKNSSVKPVQHILRSQMYSRKKSLELMEEYSNRFNVKYDLIVNIRYDMIFARTINLNALREDCIYYSGWEREERIYDLFFIFKEKYINNIKSLYDHSKDNLVYNTHKLYDIMFKDISMQPVGMVARDFALVRPGDPYHVFGRN